MLLRLGMTSIKFPNVANARTLAVIIPYSKHVRNMKKVILITLLVWTTVQTFSQTHFALDSVSYKFRIDTLYSDTLKETRFIKISFPPDYKKENKYPVFFVLDEDWMFEPTITNVKQLMEANIIPPAIVIGIHSKNRSKDLRLGLDGSFTESSRKFYHYISSEIIEYLSKNYTNPAFPILIGHSDGAVFSQKVLTQPNQPFRGIISLSIQLASGQFEEIKKFTQQHFSNHIYHFVASGSKDGTSRLNSALKIDSLFQTVNNPNIHLKTTIYNTDHFGVGIRGLNDGISFIFNDYMQENDFNEPLLDSLRKANSNPVAIIKEYLKKIEAIYNIEVLPKEEGIISVANAIITNRKQLEEQI